MLAPAPRNPDDWLIYVIHVYQEPLEYIVSALAIDNRSDRFLRQIPGSARPCPHSCRVCLDSPPGRLRFARDHSFFASREAVHSSSFSKQPGAACDERFCGAPETHGRRTNAIRESRIASTPRFEPRKGLLSKRVLNRISSNAFGRIPSCGKRW